jgi:hypothetical protein
MVSASVAKFDQFKPEPMTEPMISPTAQPVKQCSVARMAVLVSEVCITPL